MVGGVVVSGVVVVVGAIASDEVPDPAAGVSVDMESDDIEPDDESVDMESVDDPVDVDESVDIESVDIDPDEESVVDVSDPASMPC